MINTELDWAAPVIPGVAMMGLKLGTSWQDALHLLELSRIEGLTDDGRIVIQFKNSPQLIMELVNDGIVLRDVKSKAPTSLELDELFVMGFKDGKLVHLMTSLIYGASLDYYKGKICNEVGLGAHVTLLTKYCDVDFDSGDELFYPRSPSFAGLSIGGSCSSLEDDPEQTVSYIRVYKPNT